MSRMRLWAVIFNMLPILGLACFTSKSIDINKIFSEIKILQCTQNDVDVNFNYVIKIALVL